MFQMAVWTSFAERIDEDGNPAPLALALPYNYFYFWTRSLFGTVRWINAEINQFVIIFIMGPDKTPVHIRYVLKEES